MPQQSPAHIPFHLRPSILEWNGVSEMDIYAVFQSLQGEQQHQQKGRIKPGALKVQIAANKPTGDCQRLKYKLSDISQLY